jgi:branched-chain amino acid aminotransferase
LTPIAYFQGDFVPEDQANVNIKTHAFLYGSSVFEGIRGYWSPETETVYLFRAKEHYERMIQSAKLLFLDHGMNLEQLMDITKELVIRNKFTTDVYLQPRFYKSGHIVPPRLDDIETDFCCFALSFGAYLDTSKGLKVCVSSWRRVSDNAIPPRGKIGGAYVNTGLVMAEAHYNGFDDGILLTEEGHVSEGSGMNLFLVKDGKLITPRTTDNILEGITRDSIIQVAKREFGIETEARLVNRTELYLADEVFFTGTAAQVAPVTSIDQRTIGDGKNGEITMKLQQRYMEIAKGQHPQYTDWLTEVKAHVPTR